MENKCFCSGVINWKVINAGLGKAVHKGLCSKCNSVYTEDEVPEHKEGRKLANEIGSVGVDDIRIRQQSVNTQIGYFRELQHCATCHNSIGVKCNCKDCKCLYCQNK